MEINPVSASSIVESGSASTIASMVQAGSMSAIATSSNNTLPVITPSTTTPPVDIGSTNYVTETCSVEQVMPTTTMIYSTSLGPPPLIPADMFSLVSQHRPTTVGVKKR